MASVTDNFDELADTDFWLDAGVLFIGFIVPTLLKNTIERQVGQNLPDEVYGVLVVVIAEIGLDDYARPAQLGGGLYVVDALATRFGVKSQVMNLGA